MKIGLKNFRIFKEKTDFEIRPITVLTGPNNAGKSALAKLFMLLQNGVEQLNFKEGNHNISSFDKAVNFQADEKFFAVYYDFVIPYFANVQLAIAYMDSRIIHWKISAQNKVIISVDCNIAEDVKLYYKEIIDIFLQGKTLIPYGNFDHIPNESEYFIPLDGYPFAFSTYSDISFDNYKEISAPKYPELITSTYLTVPKFEKFQRNIDSLILSANALFNEIKKLQLNEYPYALFEVFLGGENVTAKYYDVILKIQGDTLSSIDPSKTEKEKIMSSLLIRKNKLENYFSENFPNIKISVIPSRSYKLLFSEGYINWFGFDPEDNGETLYNQLFIARSKLHNSIKAASFITIDRGLQFKSTANPNYDLLMKFSNSNKKDKGEFIKKAMEILGFPSEVIIQQVQLINGIGIADLLIKNKEKQQSLFELGYGFSMLLPILMQIELGGSPIFIEEPEANLHPNYQSLLADIFVLATEMFPDQKIVLETHSEYLIRKLQLLTAQGKISTEKTMIYYFNDDKNVTPENPKVIEIEINQNGSLTEDFGPGFYDEAVRLQFNLSNINREQMN